MNKRDREILDKYIEESDNLQGANGILKMLKIELNAKCDKGEQK